MKYAILGYGKMGKMVEQLLLDDKAEVVAIIDNEQDWEVQWEKFKGADVAIDFSMPSVAVANMLKAFQANVPIVVGTTGWSEQLGYVCDCCRQLVGRWSMVLTSALEQTSLCEIIRCWPP